MSQSKHQKHGHNFKYDEERKWTCILSFHKVFGGVCKTIIKTKFEGDEFLCSIFMFQIFADLCAYIFIIYDTINHYKDTRIIHPKEILES